MVDIPRGAFLSEPDSAPRAKGAEGDWTVEQVKAQVERDGYIITQNKYKGPFGKKTIKIYNAKVRIRTREGVPMMIELKGGQGLSRDKMIDLIGMIRHFASTIPQEDIADMVNNKVFALREKIEGADGKVGLFIWVPDAGKFYAVAASSQWASSGPRATLQEISDTSEKYYHFVWDTGKLTEQRLDERGMWDSFKRAAYEALNGMMGGKGGGMIGKMFPGLETVKEGAEKSKAMWKEIHGLSDDQQEQIEESWQRSMHEAIRQTTAHTEPLEATPLRTIRPEDLRHRLGEKIVQWDAKAATLHAVTEADPATLKQQLLVPEASVPGTALSEAADKLVQYGASKVKQELHHETAVLRGQIRALQADLTGRELIALAGEAADTDKGKLQRIQALHDIGRDMRNAAQVHADLLGRAHRLRQEIAEAGVPQTVDKTQDLQALKDQQRDVNQRLDLIGMIQRQRALIAELAVASDDFRANFARDAVPRLEALARIQGQIMNPDEPFNFNTHRAAVQANGVTPWEMRTGMAEQIRANKGLAIGALEEILGTNAAELRDAYRMPVNDEHIRLDRVPQPPLPDEILDLDDPAVRRDPLAYAQRIHRQIEAWQDDPARATDVAALRAQQRQLAARLMHEA